MRVRVKMPGRARLPPAPPALRCGHAHPHRVLRLRDDARAAARAVSGRGDHGGPLLRRRPRAAAPRLRRRVHVRRVPPDQAAVARRHRRRPHAAGRRRRVRRRLRRARRAVVRGAPPQPQRPRAGVGLDAALLRAGLRGRVRAAAALRAPVRPGPAAVLLRPRQLRAAAGEPVGLPALDVPPVDRGRRAARGGDPAPHARAVRRDAGRGLRAHGGGEGRPAREGRAPARGAADLRVGRLAASAPRRR